MEQSVCPPVVPDVSTEKPVAPSHVNDTLENDPVSQFNDCKYMNLLIEFSGYFLRFYHSNITNI